MERKVDLVSYLPSFLADYGQIRATLEAENPEFALIWKAADRSLRNSFITEADEYGIFRFEKMLGIHPQKGDSLETRKAGLLIKYNIRPVCTLPVIRQMLDAAVGEGNYTIERQSEKYMVKIQVVDQDIHLAEKLLAAIREMCPANTWLLFYVAYRNGYKIPVHYANRIRFTTVFYPRMNLPRLRLGGAWKLDGSRKLDGYDGSGRVNFYPVRLRVQAGAGLGPYGGNAAPEICFRAGVEGAVKPAPAIHVRASAVCPVLSHGAARARVPFPVACNVRVGDVRVYNKSRLDGAWKLDGSRKLDGGVSVL